MDKLLPVIEVEKPPEPIPIPDKKLPEYAETDNMDLMDDILSAVEDQIEDKQDIINIEEREIPGEDEVFSVEAKERIPQKIAPVNNETAGKNNTEEPPQSSEFPEKRTKRKYVRKAPMSDKQKNHLAKMREIASEKRRVERERKAKEKEDALVEKAEKKILEKKKKSEDDSVAEAKINNDISPKTPEKVNGFTKQDLDSAVLSAISQYDTLRKQQKKEKREAQVKEMKEAKMRETLARAIQPQQPTNDPWRNLFT